MHLVLAEKVAGCAFFFYSHYPEFILNERIVGFLRPDVVELERL